MKFDTNDIEWMEKLKQIMDKNYKITENDLEMAIAIDCKKWAEKLLKHGALPKDDRTREELAKMGIEMFKL